MQEVADGTCETMINEVDRQLNKLRTVAKELELPNANKLNWTLMAFVSLIRKTTLWEYIMNLKKCRIVNNLLITKRICTCMYVYVHAFCKLIAISGSPEYGRGRSFITNQLEQCKLNGDIDKAKYLNNVLKNFSGCILVHQKS